MRLGGAKWSTLSGAKWSARHEAREEKGVWTRSDGDSLMYAVQSVKTETREIGAHPLEVDVPERLLFRYISRQAALSGVPGRMMRPVACRPAAS